MGAPAGGGGAGAAEGGECRSLHWKTVGEQRRYREENECTSYEKLKKLALP